MTHAASYGTSRYDVGRAGSVQRSRRAVDICEPRPGVVVPHAEGPGNLLHYTGQHVAGLCSQAVANRERTASASAGGKVLLALPFARACVQYRCVKCSRSVDVAPTSAAPAHEHRTGDGSNVPCSGTLLPYAMPKLLHDATSFDLLPPGVELNKATLRADVACCVRVDERKVGNNPSRVVEGAWLGAELQTWGGLVEHTTKYQVCVCSAGVIFFSRLFNFAAFTRRHGGQLIRSDAGA